MNQQFKSEVDISFIIPCYNSERLIAAVIREIEQIMEQDKSYQYEIITVNDCSPDNVIAVLKKLAAHDPKIKVIDFAKNMGKHAALMAGYSHAHGKIIVSLDDDGQCPVSELWRLVEPLEKGYDIAIAQYPIKKESLFKRFGSRLNDQMARFLIGKPKGLQLSNFSAMKAYICKELLRYDNPYPYIDGLFLRSTSRIANVEMECRERLEGETGYTFRKSFALWINGFTAFSVKPLRIATLTGLICAIIGFIFGIYTIIHKVLNPATLAGYSSLMAVLLFVGGLIMIMLGLIGEYIGRIYISINNSPQYVIRQTINCEEETHEEIPRST